MIRNNLEDLSLEGKTVLNLILKKYDGRTWTGLLWLKRGASGGLL